MMAVIVGLLCGILSGFGIGGGSLLMVWMTAVLSMEHRAAQAINLLYFVPCAVTSLFFHWKNKVVDWKIALPAIVAGTLAAGLTAYFAQDLDPEFLKKIFGGFLILVAIKEFTHKSP